MTRFHGKPTLQRTVQMEIGRKLQTKQNFLSLTINIFVKDVNQIPALDSEPRALRFVSIHFLDTHIPEILSMQTGAKSKLTHSEEDVRRGGKERKHIVAGGMK